MSAAMGPNDQFIRLFEAIKDQVNSIAGSTSRELELDAASDRSRRVKDRRSEIRHVKDVRNVIAHPQPKSGAPAVVVTPDLIARTQRLLGHPDHGPDGQHSRCSQEPAIHRDDGHQTVHDHRYHAGKAIHPCSHS